MGINTGNTKLKVLIFCTMLFYITCANITNSKLTETDLHKELFKTYNPDIIPIMDISKPINIDLEMFLISVDHIDEKKQSMTVRAFLQIKWTDEFLVWDPDEFSGVTKINTQNKNIWIPDVSLDNKFENPTDIGQRRGRANVYSDGTVVIWPYQTYTVSCVIHVGKFPFDEQNCEFIFLSWTNPRPVLTLSTSSQHINNSSYRESCEWDFISSTVVRYQVLYDIDCIDHISFRIKLRRKYVFHIINVLAPLACITILNTLCFIIPVLDGERITSCISIFLTLSVYSTIVNSAMPESSDDVATFGVYIGLQTMACAVTIILTVVSVYLFYKPSCGPVPLLFKIIAYLFCTVPRKSDASMLTEKEKDDETMTDVYMSTDPALVTETSQGSTITWVTVALAIDRLCFFVALFWHVTLVGICLISVLS